jgi:GNAT superfamily N-acetyltransferase
MGSIGQTNGHANGYINGHTNGHVNGHGNGHFELPDKNSADIQLVVATPDEIYAQQIANSSEWQGALSMEAYLRREVFLANQEMTKDGGFTGWALVYQRPGDNKRRVLCGCETLRKKALVFQDGKAEEVIAHGVGSVFCPPKYRGKGYAGRMIADLGKRLQSWQSDGSQRVLLSVLFSDIGKQFYAKHGWQAFPSSHVSIPSSKSSARDLSSVKFLKTGDLRELCELDESLIRRRFSKSSVAGRSAVAMVPDPGAIGWHHAREEFVAEELFNRFPEIKGAMVGEAGSRVWCYWTRVWTKPQEEAPNTLHILRLVIENESFSDFVPATPEGVAKLRDSRTVDSIATLLSAAQVEATRWNMEEVQIWNPTSSTLASAQLLDAKAAVQHREKESIASLRWYGEGSWENVDWICNEKYGWC